MDKDPTLIILHGGQGTGEAERLMAEAKIEVARKNTLYALAAGFSRVIISTDTPDYFMGL